MNGKIRRRRRRRAYEQAERQAALNSFLEKVDCDSIPTILREKYIIKHNTK